jgi:peptidoglycan hydrolase-like protein with peptidoglycan-binding domain
MPPPQATFKLSMLVLQQRGDPDPIPDVKALQFMLIVLTGAYSPVKRALQPSDGVNGLFDAKTTNRVKQFQRSEGLRDDGIVGENTWQRLLDLWVTRFTK